MARLSATLIVRDESAVIEDCLASLAGIVDEIVLVDTGSRDDTVEKARRFPISLHTFPWCGDFSAARNFALDQASGDWILYIDADERFEVPDLPTLLRLLDDRSKAAWRLRLYPRIGWTAYAELRLFRNDPRIRFRGVIHERVHDGVEVACREDRLEIGICDLALRHVGYEADQSHKIGRNVPLLRAYLEREPNRVYCWWHLGDMLELAGDKAGAIEAWRRGVELARSQHAIAPEVPNFQPYLSLIALLQQEGEPIEALVAEGLELFPRNVALQWQSAKLALDRGDDEAARPVLERLAAIDPEIFFDPDAAYDKTLFSHSCREALALCHFRAGRYREAAHWYRLAAPAAPDPQACLVKARLAEVRAGAQR
jgi:tetratricopeptide (TPR) repeat protein